MIPSDDSKWWHWLWTQAGKPTDGSVYHIMKITRVKYHREIKKRKFDERERK